MADVERRNDGRSLATGTQLVHSSHIDGILRCNKNIELCAVEAA